MGKTLKLKSDVFIFSNSEIICLSRDWSTQTRCSPFQTLNFPIMQLLYKNSLSVLKNSNCIQQDGYGGTLCFLQCWGTLELIQNEILHSSKQNWKQMLLLDKAKIQQALIFAAWFWMSLGQEPFPKEKKKYFSVCIPCN